MQFGRQIEAKLEHKMSYKKFIQFVGNCDAVIQLSRFGVLGRMTFISASLKKPGIFTENVELNKCLYPNSLVKSPSDSKLLELVYELITGLSNSKSIDHFMPDNEAAQGIGNYRENAAKVRALLFKN
jgi:hypothetical protein